MPEPRASLVHERQAPEHSKPPFIFESLLEYVISIDALSIGVVMKPLLHLLNPCPDILPLPGYRIGSSSSLAML